jgi:hypothetical protein
MIRNYRFLSEEYDSFFQKNVEQFCKNISRLNKYNKEKYCLFYPSFGTLEKKVIDFIMYGQAPKGWTPEFKLSKVNKKELLEKAKNWSNTIDKGCLNPIDWVNINWSIKTKERFAKNLEFSTMQAIRFFGM